MECSNCQSGYSPSSIAFNRSIKAIDDRWLTGRVHQVSIMKDRDMHMKEVYSNGLDAIHRDQFLEHSARCLQATPCHLLRAPSAHTRASNSTGQFTIVKESHELCVINIYLAHWPRSEYFRIEVNTHLSLQNNHTKIMKFGLLNTWNTYWITAMDYSGQPIPWERPHNQLYQHSCVGSTILEHL